MILFFIYSPSDIHKYVYALLNCVLLFYDNDAFEQQRQILCSYHLWSSRRVIPMQFKIALALDTGVLQLDTG